MRKQILSAAVPTDIKEAVDALKKEHDDPHITSSSQVGLMICFALQNKDEFLKFANEHIIHSNGVTKRTTF